MGGTVFPHPLAVYRDEWRHWVAFSNRKNMLELWAIQGTPSNEINAELAVELKDNAGSSSSRGRFAAF